MIKNGLQRRKKDTNNIPLQNSFSPLSSQSVVNEDSKNDVSIHDDVEINYTRITIIPMPADFYSHRRNIHINRHPERDIINYRSAETVNDNPEYSGIYKYTQTVCIFSDGIRKRIKIHEFNKYLKNKKAFKKCFYGADTKALHHYALHTLQTNKPEIVIINIGLNNIKKDKPITIAEDIISLATVCKSYGVQKVFVSGITPRYSYQTKINELKNILEGKQVEYGYFS